MPKITVQVADKAYETLKELADEKGKSMADILRDAIALEKWVNDVANEGGHILVEKKDGKVRELTRL